MVGMHMRTDDPVYGFTTHEFTAKILPDRLGLWHGEAGINNGPTVLFFEQPNVDVIQ